jgi:hypothetical protein
MASSDMHAGLLQSLQLLVVRGIVNSDMAFLSNIRALPTPSDTAGTFGPRGTLQYPPAILAHHIHADVLMYLGDLAPAFHPSFNAIAAAALLGVARPLLSVLRGPDMERPGKLHASVLTTSRLEETPGFRVGTSDHLETYGNEGLHGFPALQSLALGEHTGKDLWLETILRQYGPQDLLVSPDAPRIVEALSACLTGMVPQGHFGPLMDAPPLIYGWDTWALNSETTHKLSWTLPVSVPDSVPIPNTHLTLVDFGQMRTRDLRFMLSVWDDVFKVVTDPLAAPVLNAISSHFSPTVKDLIRWGALHHLSVSMRPTYARVWLSADLHQRDLFFNKGKALPISSTDISEDST